MPTLADPSTLAALAAARRLLDRARDDAVTLRGDVGALADATDWHARATDGYRAGVSSLSDSLARLERLIDAADADLAAAASTLSRAPDGAASLALSGWW
ncbi:hypothetical protein [Microbacterium dextranolyticum]|uniref:Uncharacterized protein n=1 Tax=Microbacterium dextranolyticum TaxID=36806 RepID=A0A9W6HKA9_9MICO|nr:hypothetical protein [Microbacterium dextranolyticum]MBM7461743.1 hypothetical protein [Microbacterium dextranolyticum]GLJ93984.1 hypothetical protein GCM10017591_00450 [Microbacterium dextranolyticum]